MYSLLNKAAAWMLIIFLVTVSAGYAQSGAEKKLKRVLDGSRQQLAPDSSVTVQDSVYFNPAMQDKLDTPYKVRNIVTFHINEYSTRVLPAEFDATLNIRIIYTRPDLVVDSIDRSLSIRYDSSKPYMARNGLLFSNAHSVTVKVLSLVTESVTDITAALMLSNEMEVSPAYKWSCTGNAVQNISFVPPADPDADELTVNWPAVTGADQYDLEWTYVDSSALANHKYGNPINPGLIFRNNATQVTITPNTYNIPLIFDNTGVLFFRVRAVQLKQGYSRAETDWSSDFTGGLGSFDFGGHQRNMNWQSSISFAEDGKRKVAVKYFDGSLRDRQVVTKDNITGRVIIGENFYDYQGRPVVQVLPAPSLNSIIKYTPGFNKAENGTEYDKDQYDHLAGPADFLTEKAKPMSATTGAAAYYSPNNPEVNSGVERFVPNAHGYAFTETEYTQDNTGRISRRGGVGAVFQLGGNHETKYYYGMPSQDELDAIFGTEAGFNRHYFKDMVRDANGQYSVVYKDLRGRTVATALAGRPDSADLATLSSDTPVSAVDTLSRLGSNVVKELSLESRQTKLVAVDGDYRFKYSLIPPVLQKKDCDSNTLCYTGFYDLEITITDDAFNQRIGGVPFTVFRSFTPENITTGCTATQPFVVDFTINLPKGSYEITKKLTLNKKGLDYFRDSIAAKKLICTTKEEFIQQQRELAVGMACIPTCESCRDSLGTWPVFRDRFITRAGIPPQDSAAYRGEAFAAYEAGQAACKELCNDITETDEIRAAMLLDMTPPSGQYANPENNEDVYSIFYVKDDYTLAAYQRDTVQYLDDAGRPDQAFDEESGVFLPVKNLKQEQFVSKFIGPWAEALLKFHPEYCKLLEYERYRQSDLWDRKFEATDSYAEAKSKGYLNPTSNGSFIFPSVAANQDPLSQMSPALKTSLENMLNNYNQQSGANILSLWSVAAAAVKCEGKDDACIALYNTPAKAFNEAMMCQGDLDMAWRNFRQLYLVVKRNIISTQINNAQCTSQLPPTAAQLAAAGKQPHFNSAVSALEQNGLGYITNTSNTGAVRDSTNARLEKFYEDNCRSYVKMWVQQLAPCHYSQSALENEIIPKLIAVCREGSDLNNQYGSSSVKPGSSYQYRSFEDVLKEYNTAHGINDPLNCNSWLITAPRPYGKQPAYSDKGSYTKPEECECNNLNRLKKEFDLRKTTADADFSGYILRTRGVTVSQTDLNQLLDACSGSSPCTYFSRPVTIPALILCNTAPACVPCQVTDSLYTEFTGLFPGIAPANTENDSLQMKKNALFESFMNNRLGYQKQAWEYLAFRDSCRGKPYTDSLVCEPAVKSFGSKRYDNNGTDQMADIIRTVVPGPGGQGYVLAGQTTGSGSGGRDGYIIRTDLSGNILWAKTYGGAEDDEFAKIKPTDDGGFIAIGTTRSFNNEAGEVFIVRTDASGNVLWSKAIGFSTIYGEFGTDIIKLAGGGYAFSGRYNSAPTVGDLLAGVIGDSGNISWIRQVGSGNSDDGLAIMEDADTLLISAESYFNTLYDGVIMKLSKSTGATISTDQYDFAGKAIWMGKMKKKPGGGYEVVFANTGSFNATDGAGGIMEISQTGDLERMRLFSQPGNRPVTGLAYDKSQDGGFTLGLTTSQSGVNDIFLQRFYSNGSLASSNRIDLKGNEYIGQVFYNPDGSLAVTGSVGGNAMLLVADTAGLTGCADSAVQVFVNTGTLTVTKNISYTNNERDTSHSYLNLQAVNASPETSLLGCAGGDTCYLITSGPMLCGNAFPLFPSNMTGIEEINNCTDTAFFAASKGTELYNIYRDTVLRNFSRDYIRNSMSGVKETFTVAYSTSEYHYTLYYYNQSGYLVKTVPPAGVVVDRSPSWLAAVKAARLSGGVKTPAHRMQTQYRYNTLGQVLEQYSPDAGTNRYYYDVFGRLVLTQNAKQAQSGLYSYINYDSLGRATEVGELFSSVPMTIYVSLVPAQLKTWLNNAASSRTQITRTVYDKAYAPLEPVMNAANLRNRMAWTAIYNTASDLDSNKYTSATFYSYDIHGNVDTLIQDFKAGSMAEASNRFKKTVYRYDLISGKILQVSYQPGQADAFYHRYVYDAENRLTDVETSGDSIYWEHDAFYQYYRHGALARTVLGQQQVQGVDYVYNLQGWLKSVNSTALRPSFDPGNDGGDVISARDVLGLSMHYFGQRDYEPVNDGIKPVADGIVSSAQFRPLFNGNVAAMSVNVPAVGDALLYTYRYDVLNRVIGMQAHNNLQPGTNTWVPVELPDFKEFLTYDLNGNILTYKRAGNYTFSGKPLAMDDLTYSYKYGMNQLQRISDTVAANNYDEDIDNQEPNNYVYDTIGNLVKDVAGKLTGIEWNIYGKIKRITKEDGSVIQYYYDAAGHRMGKEVDGNFTWYVKDMSGNVLSVYNIGIDSVNSGMLTQTEAHLYGSTRLGIYNFRTNVQVPQAPEEVSLPGLGTAKGFSFVRGNKYFELGNHVGNVLAIVSDKKNGVSSDGTLVDYYLADIVSAQDYYPFGMGMPGRAYNPGEYRYGFNGKENDNEVKGGGNQVDFGARMHDPRVGRFLSIDPLASDVPWNSTYAYAENDPVNFEDIEGMNVSPRPATAPRRVTAPKLSNYRVFPNGRIGEAQAPALPNLGPYMNAIRVYDAYGRGGWSIWTANGGGTIWDPVAERKEFKSATRIYYEKLAEEGKFASHNKAQNLSSDRLSNVRIEKLEFEKDDPKEPEYVYRSGKNKPVVFTPRPLQDDGPDTGLSTFITSLQAFQKDDIAQVLSVKILRENGFTVRFDKGGHVTIRPPTQKQLEEWAATRPGLVNGGNGPVHVLTYLVMNARVGEVKKVKTN